MDAAFWAGKRVLITGHTGFKGGWLALWLTLKGAHVIGYALEPPTEPNLFTACHLDRNLKSVIGDIRDLDTIKSMVNEYQPELVVHMAAQALVRQSYGDPVDTYATNVMGTVNVLESVRQCNSVKTVLIVTSDKCYENREWYWGYREIDPMGGYDPYASSKGCVELVTSSYRRSFFPISDYETHGVAVASVRAGNVIGGGDWAQDRLIPDIFKAVAAGTTLQIRYPEAIRPWQHVLDPLHGYVCLMERLHQDGADFAQGWNFGPKNENCQPVATILAMLKNLLGDRFNWSSDDGHRLHEATYLKLDCSKAHLRLGWRPKLDLPTTLDWTAAWYQAFESGEDMAQLSENQIKRYEELNP